MATDEHGLTLIRKPLGFICVHQRSSAAISLPCRHERAQSAGPFGGAKLAQRFGFDLANSLARHVELLADLLECVFALAADGRSGEERRLLWTSVIQQDANGRVVGLAAIAHDVTEVRRVEAERAQLAAAIEQSAESVLITDRDGSITYVNRAFERLSGYTSTEVLG